MSESPGNLLVEFCKGDTSNLHDNATGFQEESDERRAGATPIGEAGVEDSQELVGEGPHGLRLEAEKHQYGAGPHVFQGVEIDQWHRPRGYRVLIQNPGGDSLRSSPVATAGFTTVTKRVPAEQMTHLAWRRRYPACRHLPLHLAIT